MALPCTKRKGTEEGRAEPLAPSSGLAEVLHRYWLEFGHCRATNVLSSIVDSMKACTSYF